MGIYKMGNKDQYLDSYKINEDRTLLHAKINGEQNDSLYLMLPLVFDNYDFTNISECVSLLSQDFVDYKTATLRANKIVRDCFIYARDYIDENGKIINLNKLKWNTEDDDDNYEELLRVFVKSLKKNTMELCSDNGVYFLVYQKKIYNYDKDKMKLELSDINKIKKL